VALQVTPQQCVLATICKYSCCRRCT
jgi:hypothetical protein